MSREIGMNAARLDEIELRLCGVDHRPWMLNRELRDELGRATITKGSNKAHAKAEWNALREVSRSEVPEGDRAVVDDVRRNAAGAAGLVPLTRGTVPRLDTAAYRRAMTLFRLGDDATEDMATFVTHAPQDVEDLLGEVKMLKKRIRDAETERDEFKKECLSMRVEKAALTEKLTEQRRAWRAFQEAMGK